MTEITRVPLRPIGKGSLTLLWLGVAVAVLLAAGVAWWVAPKSRSLTGGVTVETIEAGEGASPGPTDFALVNYRGTLPDGTVFDEGQQTPMPVNQVVPGFSTALQAMQTGGRYRVQIPADQAYGAQGSGPIPPNTDLTFEVDLLEFRTQAEVQQMQQQMMQQQMLQQMMQQQGQGGAPGAVPGMPQLPGQ
jgi:FKBP-type peptidyl-prolyl cis-trans isomerase FkpA